MTKTPIQDLSKAGLSSVDTVSLASTKNSIAEFRKTKSYRLLEGLLGYASLGFLSFLVLLALLAPTAAAVFLIVYSFLWVLKFSLNAMYTIYTYKQTRRWELFDWEKFYLKINTNSLEALEMLKEFQWRFKGKLDWSKKLQQDIDNFQLALQSPKYARPDQMFQVAVFSVYNEPAAVITRSLRCLYEAGYPLDKMLIVVSQEARAGEVHVESVKSQLQEKDWLDLHEVSETDLDVVYNSQHHLLDYQNPEMAAIELRRDKLNLIFTRHPDGLVGEIKGKASNEDWGTRQASLFLKSKGVSADQTLVTSLDADSHIGKYFFHDLSFRFCINPDRLRRGFQPVHVYSNNFFETGMWQRQVATQNTLTNFMQLGVEGDTHFFAIYSSCLHTLQEVDFWVREVIAEDYLLYAKCISTFGQEFKVEPFYGVFEGDAVEADDYFEAIVNQYKQLQRWAWGGVESIPYLIKRLFLDPEGHKIDMRFRVRNVVTPFLDHFFWSSTPLMLSVGVMLPQYIGRETFQQQQVSQNLSLFSQYFVWISFVFVAIFGFITYRYITVKALREEPATWQHYLLVALQWLIFPVIFGFMAVPALDAQIRGIRGKYLGYWVTPKK